MTTQTALEKFIELGGYEINEPLEQLRFFCSLTMEGQDWLDVEEFFIKVESCLENKIGVEYDNK